MPARDRPSPTPSPRASCCATRCSTPRATSCATAPWADITMADIARAAGVSRQTLYKEFGSRDEFAQAFVMREGERFLDAVEQAVAANTPTTRAPRSAAALEVFLDGRRREPARARSLLTRRRHRRAAAARHDAGEPLVDARDDAPRRRDARRLAAGAPSATRELLAETLVRLAISYVAMPSGPASIDGAAVGARSGRSCASSPRRPDRHPRFRARRPRPRRPLRPPCRTPPWRRRCASFGSSSSEKCVMTSCCARGALCVLTRLLGRQVTADAVALGSWQCRLEEQQSVRAANVDDRVVGEQSAPKVQRGPPRIGVTSIANVGM